MRYRRGSKGDEVSRIQTRLKKIGFYTGPVDGDFGGGTEIAVRRFQQSRALSVDGVVGKDTWRQLFPTDTDVPAPALLKKPVEYRCLALTSAFETSAPPPGCFSALSGDFDGEGISFGALQFNFGQGTLQSLLQTMDEQHPSLMEEIFPECLVKLRVVLAADRDDQLAFARSIQDPRFRLHEPWRGMFITLGQTPECQKAQIDLAARYLETATELCVRYEVWSSRALALMFDIAVQNGSIPPSVAALIDEDAARLAPGDRLAVEVARLRIVANRRAEAAKPRWIEDVRTRKLCIANGEGHVHGNYYHLEEQYGLALDTALVM
jgi:hypothetical protein